MLCDLCKKREATVHNTICISNADDEPKQSNLCDECFEASNPSEADELTTALRAGCRYCGGEPYSGSGHSTEGFGGSMNLSFMCEACAKEYFRFFDRKFPGFGNPNITKEQIAEIGKHDVKDIIAEVDEHMKKWAENRGSQ